jgi:methyl-accepting chemotaxis protein
VPAIFDQLPGFLEIGAWTTRHIRPLFDLFRDENVAPALASIIFGSALMLCIFFLIDSSFIRAQVRRRIQAVRSIKGKIEFAEAMPNIERLMLGTRYLRHSWQKFRETLIEPSGDEERNSKVVLNTARPQDYFNTAEAGLRFPLYRAMPNLLVGIGLLLTFFGLVTALFFTTAAIRSATDLAASQNALRDLLYAASFKFYTSIAGLGGSIVLTLVLRYGTSAIEKSFDALASTLESKLVFVTPESIAFDHYREAQEQTRNLRLFNTEVAISVGKRIEEALAATLPAYLAQAMAPIGKSLDDVANKLTSMNEGAIGEMAKSFVSKLQGATGDQMHGLATTLADLRSSLEQMNRGMKESGSALVDNVTRSSQEMREALNVVTAALSESADRMTAGSERASGRFNDELIATTKTFEDVSTRMAARIEEAVDAVTRGLVNESGSIGEKVTDAAIRAGEESRAKVVGAGTDLAETLSGIGQHLTDAVNRMQESLIGTVREMSNIERSIAQHVASIGQLSKATQDTEGAMANSARSMREAGAPLAESSRLIAEASRRIADSTGSSEASITGAQTEIRNVAQLLQTTLQATVQQWEGYEKRFKGVDDSLGLVLDRIIQSVQENLDALSSFVEKIDEKLSGAVDKLGGGIDELGEFAQTMEQLTVRLNGGNGGTP